MPGNLPEALTVKTATLLRSATTAADVDLVWMETPLDAEFSPIRQHQADAGLGWLTGGLDELPAPLDAMTLGEFEPDLWIPASHPAASRGTISLAEMASLHVIHGPRRASPGTYDRWLDVLRTVDPHFAFTDPPFRHSLSVVLAFAATADPPAAVLTGRTAITIAGASPGVIRRLLPADTGDMILVSIADRPLTATAALVWNRDLPRPLQQILFDTADGATPASTGIPVPRWLITSPQRDRRDPREVTAPTFPGGLGSGPRVMTSASAPPEPAAPRCPLTHQAPRQLVMAVR